MSQMKIIEETIENHPDLVQAVEESLDLCVSLPLPPHEGGSLPDLSDKTVVALYALACISEEVDAALVSEHPDQPCIRNERFPVPYEFAKSFAKIKAERFLKEHSWD